jgi:hypothetical protein
MYSTIGLGTASQATPQGLLHKHSEIGFTLMIKLFLRTVFQEVTWALRSELLKRSCKKKNNEFFKTYRACVLTLHNTQEWPMLKELLGMSLSKLMESTFGDIFLQLVFLVQSSAPRLPPLRL